MDPGTFKDWPYHTDLLVFCLKFRLSPVFEYLNYYYNINNAYWVIPEKSKQKRVEDILFWKKKRGIFRFVILPLEIPDKKKLYPWKFHKIVLQGSWKIQKPRPMETPHGFFITPGNSTSFSTDPSNFRVIFLQDPQKFHVLNLLRLDFFLE